LRLKELLRDVVTEAIAFLPLRLKLWLYEHATRLVLGVMFRLESGGIVVTRAGPTPYRHRMRLAWQAHMGYVLGVYEPHVVHVLVRHLKQGDCCMDVGANLGYFTSVMSHRVGTEGEVIAFEPLPQNVQVLQENIALEGLTNVRVEAKAVGDSNETSSLLIQGDKEFTGTPSLTAFYSWSGERSSIPVEVVTLDEYLAGMRKAPALLKIDVEGAELLVLRGATTLLSSVRPTLLIEVHGWGSPQSEEVIGLIKQHHYEVEILGLRNREAFCLASPALLANEG